MRWSVSAIISLAIVMSGCQQDDMTDQPAGAMAPAPGQPELAGQRVHNAELLEGLPAEVRLALRRDYPKASVTSVQRLAADTGPQVYRIGFMVEGEPRTVTYDRAGQVVETPLSSVQTDEVNRVGFPESTEPRRPAPQP